MNNSERKRPRNIRSEYVSGSVVRKTERKRAEYNRRIIGEVPSNHKHHRKNSSAHGASYVLFLAVAMCFVGYFCMTYLNITSEISNDLKKIAHLEAELNDLRAENDDYDNRINGAVDLELIKKRAMNDLGMQYANDDQIVKYESDDTDYVRQYISLE